MGRACAVVAGLLAVLGAGGADGLPEGPADFRLQVSSFGPGKEPVYTEEIIVREKRAYVFLSVSKEVVIIEPARGRLEILDVGRRIQSEVSFQALDASLERLKANLREAAEKLEQKGGRANAIEAEMARNLFEPRLATGQSSKVNRFRLSNPVVEIDADGEPEPDAPRLAYTAMLLGSIAKLGAFRTPEDLPPFAELETIAALTGDRRLRPTELAYLYRLAGPPRKFRRTYRLVTSLTDREVEAIDRVDRLREAAPNVRYERYRLVR